MIDAGYDYDVPPYDNYLALIQNGTHDMFVESFRARLEGIAINITCGFNLTTNESLGCNPLHGALHQHIGGHIIVAPATQDPLFFLIHNWIDAVWGLYQDKYGIYYTFPEQFLDFEYFQGLFFVDSEYENWDSNRVMDHRESLGYVYSIQLQQDNDGGETANDTEWWLDFDEVYVYLFIVLFALIGIGLICLGIWCCKRKKNDNYVRM